MGKYDQRYTGVANKPVKIVFKAACQMRHEIPTISEVIAATGTTLDPAIVSSILEGALRLGPVDRTTRGTELRRQEAWARAARASIAESEFIQHLQKADLHFETEAEQKQRIHGGATPDVLLTQPLYLAGHECHWIEFKDMFGFRDDPYVHRKNREQCMKYAQAFGPGIIVYKLGYEKRLLDLAGVRYMREAEVLAWLGKNRGKVVRQFATK